MSPGSTTECVAQLGGEDQAALDGLALCLCDQVGADAGCRAIEQSAERRGNGHCAVPLDITPWEISEVKDDSARSLEAPVCPGRGDGHVLLVREDVRELVQHQSGLVAENAFLLRPEPGDYEIFVVARGKVDQAEDAAGRPFDVSAGEVVVDQGPRIASLPRLLEGEITGLLGCQLVEAVPGGPVGRLVGHARMLKIFELTCKPVRAPRAARAPPPRSAPAGRSDKQEG